jgi:hypothetical protein
MSILMSSYALLMDQKKEKVQGYETLLPSTRFALSPEQRPDSDINWSYSRGHEQLHSAW